MVVLSLVLCFPVGLVLLWTSTPWSRGRKASVTGLVLALAVVIGLVAPSDGSSPPARTTARVTTAPSATPTAEATLDTESVADSEAMTALSGLSVAEATGADTYDRTAFGAAWTDTDRNGCDTRNDVLRRDLTGAVFKPGTQDCVVVSGTLLDPYTGGTVRFVRGQDLVEVDHVVPLADAWRTGASTWPYAKLLAFANDPLELLAVDAASNTAKSDNDAAGWLPQHDACGYAARQVAVKAKYGLAVTAEEKDALTAVLMECPGQRLPTGGQPTLAPNRSPAPRPTAVATTAAPAHGFVGGPAPTSDAGAGLDPDYGTCREAKAHGVGPYYRGRDPEYDWYQDRDHDGIVCE